MCIRDRYKGTHKVTDQIKSKPIGETTKISDFVIEDKDGIDLTEEILSNPSANLLIVNYTLKGESVEKNRVVRDSLFIIDTLDTDPITIVRKFDKMEEREESYTDYEWEPDYLEKHAKLKKFTDAAKAKGLPVVMAIGGADELTIKAFDEDTGLGLQYGMADDILLKTIVRSNPGIVLFKNGEVLDKWHIKKLPAFEEAVQQHLNE